MSQSSLPISPVGGLRSTDAVAPREPVKKTDKSGAFEELLKGQLGEQKTSVASQPMLPSNLKFSAHAVDRLKSRGISFDQDTLRRIEEGIERAAQKGSKDSLVLLDDSALIVSVKNKTVITAMDRNAMKENVFTNIDSTVIV